MVALGNTATLDGFTNVVVGVNAVIQAIIDRFGCLNVEIMVLGLLPRLQLKVEQLQVLKDQNQALFKVVRNLV